MSQDAADVRLTDLADVIADGLDLDVEFDIEPADEGLVIAFAGPQAAELTADGAVLLDAVEVLAQVAAGVVAPGTRVGADADGYREQRRAELVAQADRAAAYVARTGTPVALPPMRAAERRVVHRHLIDRGDVATRSDGREPERFIVVERPPAA
jgi:spoIIIJ-associated protein